MEKSAFGVACFRGAWRLFWQLAGMFSAVACHADGATQYTSYEGACSGDSG